MTSEPSGAGKFEGDTTAESASVSIFCAIVEKVEFRVLLCLAARQVCMCFGNYSSLLSNGGTIKHSYIPADRLTTVPVLLPLRPYSAKVVLPLEPCLGHTVQLRLSKLVIFPTTASCIFHHTSGGVWITIII